MPKILRNRIRCKNCGDIIESRHVHDYVECSCGQCAVDGGKQYLRRGWGGKTMESSYEELSEFEEDIR